MQLLRTTNCYRILLLLGTVLLLHTARGGGGGGIVARAVLDGSQHQIKQDSSRTVVDSAFFNPAYAGSIDTTYRVQNLVTLKINEASFVYLRSAFTVTVDLRIIYSNGANVVDSTVHTFRINYDSAHPYNSRSNFVFSGAHRVTIKVLSVTSDVSNWDPVSALLIENQLIAQPNFAFSC
ncbi:MAG: hypothetical protein JST39_24980, partial [Bacteroidetes bacterium]|nr:hypothetical protein [Bacteroidota bacterium]